MSPENLNKLKHRVVQAASRALGKQKFVTCTDVLCGLEWLDAATIKKWRHGQIPFLEAAVQANLSKIAVAMKLFRVWAAEQRLKPSETVYVRHGGGPKMPLQFSKSGNPTIEKLYRTHWISPKLVANKKLVDDSLVRGPLPGLDGGSAPTKPAARSRLTESNRKARVDPGTSSHPRKPELRALLCDCCGEPIDAAAGVCVFCEIKWEYIPF